jgi:hypothetical protein
VVGCQVRWARRIVDDASDPTMDGRSAVEWSGVEWSGDEPTARRW